jgi:Protein of unknown function (DUF559)
VLSLSPVPLSRLQTIRAAVMSCGHGAVASHWAAAEALKIAELPPLLPVHVTVSGERGRKTPNVKVHRSVVPPSDTVAGGGVLCTSAARTLVDLAAVAEPDRLEEILIAADSLRILNRRRLYDLLADSSRRRGARTLRDVLGAGSVRVNSRAEVLLLRTCREAGVPAPVVNGIVEVPGRRLEVDFQWPSLRLIVELDGYRFHGGRHRANVDRERDQLLTIAGWTVVRFTRDQVVGESRAVVERLRALACPSQ